MIIIPAFPEEWSLAFCRPWIRLGHPLEIAGTFQKLFEARRRIHVGDRDGDPGSEVIRVPPTHSYNAGKAGEKSWTRIEDKHLLGQTFEWEAPIRDTHLFMDIHEKGNTGENRP